jgi:uncharacterized membrane protein YbhN (UPF0104 family)
VPRSWLSKRRNWLSLVLGAALSAGFLAVAFRQTDWPTVASTIAGARPGWLPMALGGPWGLWWLRGRPVRCG